MADKNPIETSENGLSRRDFMKLAAVAGGSAAFLGAMPLVAEQFALSEAGNDYLLTRPENQLYSICQQCNTQCGIKVKLIDGVAAKIEGNPYSPWNMVPHLAYETPVADLGTVEGGLCPRGQAGVQSVYDPYRLVKVLKRAGKRGENKWTTIPFAQAVAEIVQGGQLFAHVPGEENRVVEGLDELWALRDPDVMKAMGGDVSKILAEKDPEKKRELVTQFKEDHAAHLDKMIDPEHPDLGPKNNQILYFWGRQKAGRGDFVHRFFGSGLGTTNRHGHTTVCQGSLYFAGKSMTEQWDGSKWTGGSKMYWMGDTASARFVIFVGASPFEGNYGVTNRVPRMTRGLADGSLKLAVIDPRLSKTAAKAWKWLTNNPGTEAAIALALIRWVIDNERYDARYLANANKAAAKKDKEPTWSNAAWLVKIDEKGAPGKLLRGSDLQLVQKLEEEQDGKKVTTFVTGDGAIFKTDPFVTLDNESRPLLFDPNDEENAADGQLLVDTRLDGIRVKSGLQVLHDSASVHTIEEWADIAGVRARDLVALAREFTSYGKNAAVDIHRGVSQHTNGYYNVLCWFNLALLIGNYDWKGGQTWPSTYDLSGNRAEGPFQISAMNPGALSPFGISLIRHDVKYEDTTLFLDLPPEQRYPAKRNWYPLASDVYQEIITSAADAYPYPIKAAFMYMGSPVYSLPGGHTWIPILQDVEKLPLFVASDIVVGETSMYADYIFPDVTYLERWEFSGTHPSVTFKVQGVRQPVISPLTGTVTVYGQEQAQQWEALLLALAEKLGLPNFGPHGFGEGVPFTHPDHLYLRMVANLAFGEKADGSDALARADAGEISLFRTARRHLDPAVFDFERLRQSVGNEWPRVITVLNRGGRFQAYEKGYPGDGPAGQLGVKFGKQINMYLEKTAVVKRASNGQYLPGYATYLEPATAYDGTVLDDRAAGYDLKLITYRDVAHTKSRTPGNYWLLSIMPENYLLMNSVDAAARGLKDGDEVHVSSATNRDGLWDFGNGQRRPMTGKVKVTEGIRPGVVSFSLSFGHWAYGASTVSVDGVTIPGDVRRGTGIHANAAMRLDPLVTNTCLSDPVGASAVFYDTDVKVVKV
jgi:tetrathionate reductase subunit A